MNVFNIYGGTNWNAWDSGPVVQTKHASKADCEVQWCHELETNEQKVKIFRETVANF